MDVEPAHPAASSPRRGAAWGVDAWLVLALVVLAVRVHLTWFVVDDAFIDFRYARNLLAGRGLVWNAGEAVEGYTSLAWVLQVALVELVGPPERLVPWLGVAWTVVTLGLVVALARVVGRPGAAALAVSLLATNRSFAMWTTGGLETRCFTALVLATWLATSLAVRGRLRPEVASALAGIAAMTRPEGVALGLLVIAAWPFLHRRDPGVLSLARVATPFAALVGAHLAWRWSTYGALVPNTALAKVNDAWWEGGLGWLGVIGIEYGLAWLLPLAVAGLVASLVGGRREVLLGVAFAAVVTVELAYVGGDNFEHRQFDTVFAVLSLLAGNGLAGVADPLRRAWLVGVTLVVTNVLPVAEDLRARVERPNELNRVNRPEPEDVAPLLAVPGLRQVVSTWLAWNAWCLDHNIGTRWRINATYALRNRRDYACWEEATDLGLVPEDAVLAAQGIGVLGYHLKDTRLVDVHGLTDAAVARQPPPAGWRVLAHEHFATGTYLAARGVDFQPLPCSERPFEHGARYALRLRDGVWAPLVFLDPSWFALPAWRGRLHRAVDDAGRPVPTPYPMLHDEAPWTHEGRGYVPHRRLTAPMPDTPGVRPWYYGGGPELAWTTSDAPGTPWPFRRVSEAFLARAGEPLGIVMRTPGVEVGVIVGGVEVQTARVADTVDGQITVDLDPWAGQEVRLEVRASTVGLDAGVIATLLLDRLPWEHVGEPGWGDVDPTKGAVIDTPLSFGQGPGGLGPPRE